MSGFESTGATREPRDERGDAGGRGDRREDRDGGGPSRRDDRDRSAPRPMPVPPTPAPMPTAPMSPELGRYFELLSGVENASRCLFVGENDAVVGEAPVKEMIEAIGQLATPAKAVVFDGIVSQRLLDVVQEKGIGTVVGSRLGPIGKFPDQVKVYTRADLGGPSGSR